MFTHSLVFVMYDVTVCSKLNLNECFVAESDISITRVTYVYVMIIWGRVVINVSNKNILIRSIISTMEQGILGSRIRDCYIS